MKFDVVLLCAGNSSRAGQDKITLPIGEDTVLSRVVNVFFNHPDVDKIILVLRRDLFDVGRAVAGRLGLSRFRFAEGGKDRTESVENGLKEAQAEGVLIHDGARPFVSAALVSSVINSVCLYGSGIPVLPLSDSVRQSDGSTITGVEDRDKMCFIQTPQGFLTKDVKLAYSLRGKQSFSDDGELYAKYVSKPHTVAGDTNNRKITTASDCLGYNAHIGIGYDLHRLAPCRKLMVGGIEIASDLGSIAHSDGDAVIHALIDAMLSAIGERDIGFHFPDTDPRYRDIDSAVMLSEVADMYMERNFKLTNVSIIVKLDKPKLADYIDVMRVKLANLLRIRSSLVAISAKTTEGTSPDTYESFCAVTVT